MKLKNVDQDEKNKKIAEFLNRHQKAIIEWQRKHPNTKPPIIEDANGMPRWVNRKERRSK